MQDSSARLSAWAYITRLRAWGLAGLVAADTVLLVAPDALPMPVAYGLLCVQLTLVLALTSRRT